MARYIGPVCRLCRREGLKLFLKGTRCDTPKCAVDRREGVPGMHQFRRSKASEYSIRLREKQKVKRYYGVFERQFRKYYDLASRRPGNTGAALMSILERRLDNVVTRLGFALSRPQGRQMITHGTILIENGTALPQSFRLENEPWPSAWMSLRSTRNAGELIDKLTLYMNKVRQAAITKEIIEVVSGAASAG